MAKIYSQETPKSNQLNPKNETISFLLNYSKALCIIKYNKMEFEAFQN
jgi:hypothetical protein